MVVQNGTSEESSLLQDSAQPTSNDDGISPLNQTTISTRLIFKIAAAMFSFSTLGLFNSSIGPVLPLLSNHYHLTDLHVSLIFLAGPVGYVIAAQCSDTVHARYGQRGIAVIGPIFQFISTATVASHPSFGMVLVAFAFQGLGAGLLDGSWCAWAGSMEKANTISGMLHGSYSLGGAAGPFLVTAITTSERPWYMWYSTLAGASALSFIFLVTAFRHEDAIAHRKSKHSKLTDVKPDFKAMLKYSAVWLCAAYFITYVGTETAISGWVVSFMLRSRNATPYIASLTSSGYWIGMVVGRVSLGFATDRMGVRRATILYFVLAVGIEALFAVFSSSAVSIVLMTFLGFLMGPMFPSAIVVLTHLVPGELHVAAVSFVASLGQIGGAFLPFAIGAVVQGLGIGMFRFAILVQTILALLVWLAFARLRPSLPLVGVVRED
ncbi:MFS transporter-like protein [Plenodomus tracheiphilus IPT5]|uniref:MFS transporter-like protein n=1 Tax=Plenodomus tracheiphilus IPT5 TaxID=1408161 RepID=A0A6A7BKA1_9PLEO|nr:MFS transporter-like protein [Plenodomus tracheiphilus IPT5]